MTKWTNRITSGALWFALAWWAGLAGAAATATPAPKPAPEPAPEYVAPDPAAPLMRREGGLVTDDAEALSGTTRGMARGMSRGMSRGMARGMSRGMARGMARGMSRGMSRGMARGMSRGMARGMSRGMARGEIDGQPIARLDDGYYDVPEQASRPLPDILAPLAPQRTGWTHNAQPRLYWYLSQAWSGTVGFAINPPDSDEPVLELEIPPAAGGAHAAGMHSIDLARHGLSLKSGVDYEWFVYIVPDPIERSADLLASATIRYVPGAAAGASDYATLAHDGLWYDAIQTLSEGIERRPGDVTLKAHRAGLIDQVGMPRVALYDRGAAR